ncbi:hypothetical protein [Bosea thiooxidans]
MSDVVSIAQGFAAMQAASLQQALSTEMVRQNAESAQSLVSMLEQSVEQAKAILPEGQGAVVDRTA